MALLAILADEPERRAFNEAIEATDSCMMSTATLVETMSRLLHRDLSSYVSHEPRRARPPALVAHGLWGAVWENFLISEVRKRLLA